MNENNQDRRMQARQKAQNHFTATEQRDAVLKKELESERARSVANTARLRALRLAKEAAEQAASPQSDAEPAKRAPRRTKQSVRRMTAG
jgi:hypothetical protein